MPLEIERKFLVEGDNWREEASESRHVRQGYLASSEKLSVRVRIIGGKTALLTLKGARSGAAREEFEYPVPVEDAEALLALAAGGIVEKTRYRVAHGGQEWELDVFSGENDGLVVAEVELPDAEAAFQRPDWLGAEVTDDRRYYNAALAENPYRSWGGREG